MLGTWEFLPTYVDFCFIKSNSKLLFDGEPIDWALVTLLLGRPLSAKDINKRPVIIQGAWKYPKLLIQEGLGSFRFWHFFFVSMFRECHIQFYGW